MPTSAHSVQQPTDGIHVIHAFTAASQAARNALTVASTDIGRVCLQTDTGAFWALQNNSPMRWQKLGGGPQINTQAGTTYTTTIDDADGMVRCTSASAVSVTIPPNSSAPYLLSDTILFEQQGAGLLTLVAGAGVTLEGSSLVSFGTKSILCATQTVLNTWVVYGKTT